jgi:hypothetical protein
MIAFYRLACDDGQAFVTTLENDGLKKRRVSLIWSSGDSLSKQIFVNYQTNLYAIC